MALSSDYFADIVEAVENAENAYESGNFNEAAEYMEEVRDAAARCLEEIERLEYDEEDE